MRQYQPEELLNNKARLKWACRRGMLELDVLLGNFLEEAYEGLNPADKRLFIRLLESTDPDLFAWLMGKETPPTPELHSIVTQVRSHARSRF